MGHHHHGQDCDGSHHAHDHGHHHVPDTFGRAFAVGTALNLIFVAIEIGYGLMSNSLALLADAAHNFSDVVGLLMAWGAHYWAQKPPTASHTYGYRRASILAAVANAGFLLAATAFIAFEAVKRFSEPQDIATQTVGWVAAIGIAVNLGTALMFMRGRKDDININGAFLHMAADAAVSLGVVVGAIAIYYTGLNWIDPVLSLVIAAVIVAGSWDLARKGFNLAMDAVPHNVNRDKIQTYLAALPGVTEVHDLHIWAMGTTENALTAHLVRPSHGLDDAFLQNICRDMKTDFNIHHTTLQIENSAVNCAYAQEHTI